MRVSLGWKNQGKFSLPNVSRLGARLAERHLDFLLSGNYSGLLSALGDPIFLCFAATKFVVICFIRAEN